MPSPPFRPVVLLLAALDLVLLAASVGAQAYDRAFPASCRMAPGSRISLPCVTPAQALAGASLLVLVPLLVLTLALLILSQALLQRRIRRQRDAREPLGRAD